MAGSVGMTSSADLEGAHRAARLPDATEAARERLGSINRPTNQPEMDRIVEAVRARCGGDTEAFRIA
jgi:hypothetical protein